MKNWAREIFHWIRLQENFLHVSSCVSPDPVSLLISCISCIHPHCFNAVFRNGKNFKSSTRHKSHLAITTQAGNAKIEKKPFLILLSRSSLYNRNRNKHYQLKWSLPKNNFLWHNLLSETSLLATRKIKLCRWQCFLTKHCFTILVFESFFSY